MIINLIYIVLTFQSWPTFSSLLFSLPFLSSSTSSSPSIATSLMSQEKISQILLKNQVFDDDMKIVVGSLDFLNIKGTLSK